jgi:hypothetical protein
LNRETFVTRQALMNSDLVVKLATELINFRPPDVAAIIAGLDSTGPHIYVAQNSDVTCQDGVGFASIGAGHWHANSQFMFAGHTRQTPAPETLLTIYSAKRRAEVAPGVGREGTDMFFIPALGEYAPIGSHVLVELETIYKAAQKKQSSIAKQSRGKIYEFFERIAVPPTPVTDQATVPADSGGSPPTNEKNAGEQPASDVSEV